MWNLKYFQTALMELWIPRECCRFTPNTFNPVGVSGDLNNELIKAANPRAHLRSIVLMERRMLHFCC